MAYTAPLKPPLTQSQSELIAQISSMKSLISIPRKVRLNIPKREQTSIYEYILQLLAPMGIDPEFLFKAFLKQYITPEKISQAIVRTIAKLTTKKKKSLNPNYGVPLFSPSDDADAKKEKEKALEDSNYLYLITNPLIMTGLTAAAVYIASFIAKKLLALMFGEKAGASMGLDNNDPNIGELYEDGACGSAVFSLSSESNKRNEDIYFNIVKIKERLEKGDYNFKVSCQGIEVELPEDPEYLFTESAPGQVSSSPRTPAQSLSLVIDYVGNETQRQRGSSRDANSASKDFSKDLIEKLIAHIMVLVKPLFIGIVGGTPGLVTGYDGILNVLQSTGIYPEANDFSPMSSCELISKFGQTAPAETDSAGNGMQLAQILTNIFFQFLTAFLLRFLIKKFKELVAGFLAERAKNRFKRKRDKNIQKFSLFAGVDLDQINKAKKYAKAMKPVTSFVSFS